MKYLPLGSSDAIGASCHYLQIDGTGILLDTGVDPEEDGLDGLPRFDLVSEHPDRPLDHVMVTHAHHDHLGALPVVIKKFPHVSAHMTRATRDLADILLPASARLQERKQREGTSPADPVFSEEDAEASSYVCETHELESSFDVTGLRGSVPVRARFYDAGHVLGSVGILLEFKNGKDINRVFFTGDTGMQKQTILPGASYPQDPVDTLLLECTLGADPETERTTRREEETRLGEAIASTLKRKGTVLIPVFALGRGQEILALVDRFKQRGIFDEETPVYTAGLMRAIANIYDKTSHTTPRLNEDFQVFGVSQSRLPRSHTALKAALSEPSIHVVGSGMVFERTISNRLAQALAEDKKNAILMVGYTPPESPGHQILEAAREGRGTKVVIDRVRGEQPLNCTVERFRFSGHSHRRDLLSLVGKLSPKKIVLVHGEKAARKWMAENIRYFHPEIEVYSPETGEEINI